MSATDPIIDVLDRVQETVHAVLDGLDEEQLTARVDPEANSIAWLVWHLTRIQDDHLADAARAPQVWTSDGWAERFALPFYDAATGYGHDSDDVAAVAASAADLRGYHDAVHARSVPWLRTLSVDDLARVVDESWDPPVTLAVRLVSVVSDDLQHAGQAAFIRGVVERSAPTR